MSPTIPGHIRIILIPDDERSHREYSISRAMVLLLGALGLMLAGGLAFVLLSYAELAGRSERLPGLEAELAQAKASEAKVRALVDELQQMGGMQEQVLAMLGVEPPSPATEDTLVGSVEAAGGAAGSAPDRAAAAPAGTVREGATRDRLSRVAGVVMTPPPDLWPAKGYVTQEFAEADPARGTASHEGIDIAGQEGSPILAAGPGRVVKARWHEFLGNFVEIQHGFEYVTVYGHCSRLAVREGDRVDRGQVIAYLGATGEASAPHLHFEIWKGGVAVDPRRVIAGDPPH